MPRPLKAVRALEVSTRRRVAFDMPRVFRRWHGFSVHLSMEILECLAAGSFGSWSPATSKYSAAPITPPRIGATQRAIAVPKPNRRRQTAPGSAQAPCCAPGSRSVRDRNADQVDQRERQPNRDRSNPAGTPRLSVDPIITMRKNAVSTISATRAAGRV